MFHYIYSYPYYSVSLSIPPSISSIGVQLLYPFITCLGGGAPYVRTVYIVLLIYPPILPYHFLLPVHIYYNTSYNITSSDAIDTGLPSSS